MLGIALALLVAFSLSFSAQLKYCIQVAAERQLEPIKVSFQKVKNLPKARIEKRDRFYLLRVGAEDRSRDLIPILRKVRKYFPDAFIKKCEIREDYVVYPKAEIEEKAQVQEAEETKAEEKPKSVQATEIKPEPKEEEVKKKPVKKKTAQKRKPKVIEIKDDKEIKELLISIRNELSIIRQEINSLKKTGRSNPQESEENPAYFEKFLYSVGIFTGGLFFFTWILLILLYRKVGASNVENANLLNDMFKLIKVLNLLNKGQIIKMENGKLLIYDRKNERWREVD
ncbi:hypothetical protein [Hydrogenivirga sp.]